MTDGMQCVLELLRGEVNNRDIPLAEWQSALRVAEQENILPFFAVKFRQSDATAPGAILDKLTKVQNSAAQSGFWWTCELKGILRAFAEKAIPVLPLKGPFLAERLYGGISHRVSRDLDLLVHPSDMGPRACCCRSWGSSREPNRRTLITPVGAAEVLSSSFTTMSLTRLISNLIRQVRGRGRRKYTFWESRFGSSRRRTNCSSSHSRS
jgi:hypothetical protein